MEATIHPIQHQWLFDANGFKAEMCLEPESLDLAYQLRYKAYFNAGAIPSNQNERFKDKYDGQPNARTFLIWYDKQVVASVRSFTWSAHYNWARTPSIDLFEQSVDKQLGLDKAMLESNRYVVDPNFTGRKSLTAQMLLFRIQTMGAILDQCNYVITAVRPRHIPFYERFMNFYSISETLNIPEVGFPIQLLATPTSSSEVLAQNSSIAAFAPDDLTRYENCLTSINAQ